MQKRLTIFVCIVLHYHVSAQNLPSFRQFYSNPSLFNPAFTGFDGYTEISLIHRQQWINITDAPVSSAFNIQLPTGSRASFGFNVQTQEAVALRSTAAKGVFAYRVPISKNQFFSFGLSAGVGFNNLDLENIDYSNDPAILGAADNRVYADANFGALYSLHGLKAGFALPRLFGQSYISPQALKQNKFSQLNNQIYSLSYKFSAFQDNVALEPYFIYRMNRDYQNSWESSLILYYKDKVWIGASYHNTQGIAMFLGMSIKERFRFGYGYELPPTNQEFISTSSHEIHLGLRLGKKKGRSNVTEKNDPGVPIMPESALEVIDEPPVETSKVPGVEKDRLLPPIETQSPKDTAVARSISENAVDPPKTLVLLPGYYIIVGAYRSVDNAFKRQESLQSKGHRDLFVGLYGKKGIYYVCVYSTYDLDDAREKVGNFSKIADFNDAWILRIE